MSEKHITLIDHIGRTIIGVLVGETEKEVTVRNPVIIHVQPQQNGQLAVNTFPMFFFEFIDKEYRLYNDWTFNKGSIVTSNVTLNPEVIKSYTQLNTPPAVVDTVASNPKVVSINDL